MLKNIFNQSYDLTLCMYQYPVALPDIRKWINDHIEYIVHFSYDCNSFVFDIVLKNENIICFPSCMLFHSHSNSVISCKKYYEAISSIVDDREYNCLFKTLVMGNMPAEILISYANLIRAVEMNQDGSKLMIKNFFKEVTDAQV